MAKVDKPSARTGATLVTGRGAVVYNVHIDREVKAYGLLEPEIKELATLGKEQRLWSSICAGAFGLAIGVLSDILNRPKDTAIAAESVMLLTLIVTAVLFSLFKAWYYSRAYRETIAALASGTFERGFWAKLGDRILSWVPFKVGHNPPDGSSRGATDA